MAEWCVRRYEDHDTTDKFALRAADWGVAPQFPTGNVLCAAESHGGKDPKAEEVQL